MLPQDYTLDESSPIVLEDPLYIDDAKTGVTIGLVRDENPSGKVLLSPSAVKTLVDCDLTVLMQHGFSAGTSYTDMNYADVGAEFVDDFYLLATMAKTLVKFQPFEEAQLDFMRYEQTIFSTFNPQKAKMDYIQMLTMKRISAFAFNLIEDADGHSVVDKILANGDNDDSLSNFVLPYVKELAFNSRLRFVLQKTPALMDSVYCFNGEVCNRDIADLLNLPYRDIVTLCWELN